MKAKQQPPATLSEAQAWLSGLILGGESALAAAADEAGRRLSGESRRDADARLRAYVGGYPARIREALEEAYPAVATVIGESEFGELARRYGPAAPVGQYSLSAAARDLESFLRSDALTESLPFLPELAALEWLVVKAFHATDEAPADLSATVSWDLEQWSSAVFEFKSSLAVVASEWAIHDLWLARDTPREEIDIVVEGRPQSVVIYRYGDVDSVDTVVRCEKLDASPAAALSRLLAGASLGDVMGELADAGEDPASVGRWFADWASAGLVTRVG